MRLLDTRTGQFRWVEDPGQVSYAILSHVWAKEGDPEYVPEQTYQDIRDIQMAAGDSPVLPMLSDKIRRFCELAQKDGFDLGWVDTCCIDKTSSSELSEAINSMYDWYRYAGACYAFLHDVSAAHPQKRRQQFRKSKWFTRGWTLQELIAPSVLLFLSKEWDTIGSKRTLAALIEGVTGIERTVLTFKLPLEGVNVARRMSWASKRITTREEDEAYSLMGIFGVNMPTIYGEGRYAFIRLQEEILRHIPDQTIFMWGQILPDYHRLGFSHPSGFTTVFTRPKPSAESPSVSTTPSSKQYLLASSPRDFISLSEFKLLRRIPREAFAKQLGVPTEAAYQVCTMTPYGIQVRFPLIAALHPELRTDTPIHLAPLAYENSEGRLLALVLRPQAYRTGKEYFVGAFIGRDEPPGLVAPSSTWTIHYWRLTYLAREQVDYCLRYGFFEMSEVYISYRPSYIAIRLEHDKPIHRALRSAMEPFEVRLFSWSRRLLLRQGYRVQSGIDADIAIHSKDSYVKFSRTPSANMPGLVISSRTVSEDADSEYISIQIGRCSCMRRIDSQLGVLVTSSSCRVLPGQLADDAVHGTDHPMHVYSWAFYRGTASKELELKSPDGTLRTLKLTLTREASDPALTVRAHVYRLGVEIWNSGDAYFYHVEDEGAMGLWDDIEHPRPPPLELSSRDIDPNVSACDVPPAPRRASGDGTMSPSRSMRTWGPSGPTSDLPGRRSIRLPTNRLP